MNETPYLAKFVRGVTYRLRDKVFTPEKWVPITESEREHLEPMTEAVLSPGFNPTWDDESARVEDAPLFIFVDNDGTENVDQPASDRDEADRKAKLIEERRRSARRRVS